MTSIFSLHLYVSPQTHGQALLSLAAAAQWLRAMQLLKLHGGAVNFLSFYAVLRACEDGWVASHRRKSLRSSEVPKRVVFVKIDFLSDVPLSLDFEFVFKLYFFLR